MNEEDFLNVRMSITPEGNLRIRTEVRSSMQRFTVLNAIHIMEGAHRSLTESIVVLMDAQLQALADSVDPEDREAYNVARAAADRLMAVVLPNPLDKLN